MSEYPNISQVTHRLATDSTLQSVDLTLGEIEVALGGTGTALGEIKTAVEGNGTALGAIKDAIEALPNATQEAADRAEAAAAELETMEGMITAGLMDPFYTTISGLGDDHKVHFEAFKGETLIVKTESGALFTAEKLIQTDEDGETVAEWNLSSMDTQARTIELTENGSYWYMSGGTAQDLILSAARRPAGSVAPFIGALSDGDDLNDLIIPGQYICSLSDVYLHAPNTQTGRRTILVLPATTSQNHVLMIYINYSKSGYFTRWCINGSWTEWGGVGFGTVKDLVNGEDLDDLSQHGMYGTTYAYAYTNSPDGGANCRKEIYIHKSSMDTSVYFMYYVNHSTGKMYVRFHSGSTWSDWSEISSGYSNAIQLNAGSAQQVRYPLNDTYSGGYNYDPYTYHKKVVTLLHMSDVHGYTGPYGMLMDWANANPSLYDDILCTGDIVDYYNEETGVDYMAFWKTKDNHEKILVTIGNHDAKNQPSSNVENWVRKTMARSRELYMYGISNWGVTSPSDTTYWYKDYANSDLRLIGLDTTVVAGSTEDTAQKSWLTSVLADAKTNGKAVVIAQHYQPNYNVTTIACDYTATNRNIGTNHNMEMPTAYYGIVDAFIDGGGEFICWLAGHTHLDLVEYNSDYPEQPFIVVTSLMNDLRVSDQARTKGSSSYVAANIIGFDTDRKLIKMARVGANYDYNMRPRDVLVYNYNTKTIVRQSSGD